MTKITHLNGEEGRKWVLPGPIHPHRLDYWQSRHKSRVPVIELKVIGILWWTNYKAFLSDIIDQHIPSETASMFKWGCELSNIMNRNIDDICNKVSSWGRKRDPCFGLALECRNQLGLSRLAWTLPSHLPQGFMDSMYVKSTSVRALPQQDFEAFRILKILMLNVKP